MLDEEDGVRYVCMRERECVYERERACVRVNMVV